MKLVGVTDLAIRLGISLIAAKSVSCYILPTRLFWSSFCVIPGESQMNRIHVSMLATVLLFLSFLVLVSPATLAQTPDSAGSTVPPPPPSPTGWLLENIVLLDTGDGFACALDGVGTLKCWGFGWDGELGTGLEQDLRNVAMPVQIEGAVRQFSTGYNHACAVTTSGTAYCWGNNSAGQLGNGDKDNRGFPTRVHGLETGVREISAGWANSCAVLENGKVTCWGDNQYGQLGDGTTISRTLPVEVVGLSDAITVSTGWPHSCALKSDGSAWCWGGNRDGSLGNGTSVPSSTPVSVTGVITQFATITVGFGYTCGLDSGGGSWCWGSGQGVLGTGTIGSSLTPTATLHLTSGVLSLHAGAFHNCAVTALGEAKCWGNDDWGRTGVEKLWGPYPPSDCVPPPAQPRDVVGGYPAYIFCEPGDVMTLTSGVQAIAPGVDDTCVLMLDGTVRCWGRWLDRVGVGIIGPEGSPSQIADARGKTWLGFVRQ